MYLTSRAVMLKNIAVASLNGAITLIILLIAPLGLASVIVNTALVTVASFLNATFCDRLVRYLQSDLQARHTYLEYIAKASAMQPKNSDAHDPD